MHDYKKLYKDLCKAIVDNTEELIVWDEIMRDDSYPIVRLRYIADEMEHYNSITNGFPRKKQVNP